VKLRAPVDAQSLMRRMGIEWHGEEASRARAGSARRRA
jgi:hypothetical protein